MLILDICLILSVVWLSHVEAQANQVQRKENDSK
jgi:hypothetical protein